MSKELVRLDQLPEGSLFRFTNARGGSCVALKTEYRNPKGAVEAYIVGSGEAFWGEVKTAQEMNALMVEPIEYTEPKSPAMTVKIDVTNMDVFNNVLAILWDAANTTTDEKTREMILDRVGNIAGQHKGE